MVQRICPVCDQVMKSAHYCRTCRSWVKDPWVREVGYYLNERHPQNETGCSYHESNQVWERQSRQGKASAKPNVAREHTFRPNTTRPNASQPNIPRPNVSQPNTSRPNTPWTDIFPPGGGKTAAAQPKSRAGASKKNKNISLILIIIIAIYITFMLVGAGLAGSLRRSLIDWYGSGFEFYMGNHGNEVYETAPAEQVYHELEDVAVIAAGEACSLHGHFNIQGEALQQPLEEILNGLGYDLEDCYKYSTNLIYDSGESWYDTMISMDLAWDESDTYQYIELNYDTATGELHEVNVVMADDAAAVEVAAAVLKYMEDAGAIPQDQACSESVKEELKSRLLSGENMYCTVGDVEISAFSHSDSYGIYISHIMD